MLTSATTNADRTRFLPALAVPPRPPSFMASWTSAREICQAGKIPKKTPVSNDTPSVKNRTPPLIDTVSINGGVLFFTLGVSLLTGVFFGIFPAWQISRADVHEAIKEGGRGGTASAGRKRVRSALVVAEVSISLVLLVGAGLLIRSFYRVLQADPGFNSSGVLTGAFSLPDSQYKSAVTQRLFINQLAARLEMIPGVQAAGVKIPLLGGWQTGFMAEGRPRPEPGKGPSTDISRVTPGALQALGVPLLRGRYFTLADSDMSQPVCIIDATMAQTLWPGENPIGKHIAVESRGARGDGF